MNFTISVNDAKNALTLKGRLDDSVSHMITADMFRNMDLCLPCEVDLSGIESIDARGINLLIELKETGLVSRFTRHSEGVLQALGQGA